MLEELQAFSVSPFNVQMWSLKLEHSYNKTYKNLSFAELQTYPIYCITDDLIVFRFIQPFILAKLFQLSEEKLFNRDVDMGEFL